MNNQDRDKHAAGHEQQQQAAASAPRRRVGGHEADNHDDAELAFHRDEVRREQESLQTRNVEHFPLNDAAAIGDLKVVQKIVQKDPTAINLQDRNAVRGGHLEVVKFLVDHGSDIGAKTTGGGSPLWWARRALDPGHSVTSYLEDIGAPDKELV